MSVKNIYFIKIQVTEGLKTVQDLEIIGVTQKEDTLILLDRTVEDYTMPGRSL